MLVWPMSSPKMTRMFGLRPGVAGRAGGCCACATRIEAPALSADVAASVVPPSRMLRRLNDPSFVLVSSRSFFQLMMSSILEPGIHTADGQTGRAAGERPDDLQQFTSAAAEVKEVRREPWGAALHERRRRSDLGLVWTSHGEAAS